jgi:hypothetical protein
MKFIKFLLKIILNTKGKKGAFQFSFSDRVTGKSQSYMMVNISLLNFICLKLVQNYLYRYLKKRITNPERIIINCVYNKYKKTSSLQVILDFRSYNHRKKVVLNF